jgi:hypothetical protein
MANLKVSLMFNWGARGWSEQYYRQGSIPFVDPITGQVTGNDAIIRLFKARCGLLCGVKDEENDKQRPTPVGYRVSDLDSGKSKPFAAPGDVVAVNSAVTFTGDRRNFAYGTAELGNGGKRTVKVKGIQERWVLGDMSQKIGVLLPGMGAKWNPFAQALVNDAWQGRVQVLSGERAINAIDTDVIQPDPPARQSSGVGSHYVVTTTGGTYAQNQKVVIKGARGLGLRGINGVARIIEVRSNGVLVLSTVKCDPCLIDPKNLGSIFNVTYTQSNILSVCFTGWGTGVFSAAFFSQDGRPRRCCP